MRRWIGRWLAITKWSVTRFVIRLLRLGGGALLAALAWWAGVEAWSIATTPFSSLTLASVVGFFLCAGLAWVLGWGALLSAFGPGPTPEQAGASARAAAEARAQIAAQEAAQQRARREGFRAAGYAIGRFFRRHR